MFKGINLSNLVQYLPILVPFGVGWVMKSPFAKSIPAPVAKVLAKLDPATVQDVVSHLSSKDARHDTAADLLTGWAGKQGINLTPELADKVVSAIDSAYSHSIRAARKN